jgi:hypothetical protein
MSYDILSVLIDNISYDIQYGGVLYPVWSKTENVSYDIQYGGVLYPVWSKTDNISYDIQYGGVLYPVSGYSTPPYCMSYDTLSALLHTG